MIWLYYILMTSTFAALELSVFRVLRAQGKLKWLCFMTEQLFGVLLILCLIVAFSNPGYLQKDEKMDFV